MRMLAERETYESDDEEQTTTNKNKEEISIGKINIDYEAIIANKTAQEKENLSSGMKVVHKTKFFYQQILRRKWPTSENFAK